MKERFEERWKKKKEQKEKKLIEKEQEKREVIVGREQERRAKSHMKKEEKKGKIRKILGLKEELEVERTKKVVEEVELKEKKLDIIKSGLDKEKERYREIMSSYKRKRIASALSTANQL